MTFSQEHGYKPVGEVIQFESMDEPLRNNLWNALSTCYWNTFEIDAYAYNKKDIYSLGSTTNEELHKLCTNIWITHYKRPIDELDRDWRETRLKIREYFFSYEWYEVYDLIEFISQSHPSEEINKDFKENCNKVLEQEMSAYRFVGDRIARIVDNEEIDTIEKAIEVKEAQAGEHLKCALEQLSDRKSPDYRNSIKESISAVESLLIDIIGEKDSLSELLEKIDDHIKIPPALKKAFSSLYGHTYEGDDTDFEDAKFMLVTCSAFINYVRGKLNQANSGPSS